MISIRRPTWPTRSTAWCNAVRERRPHEGEHAARLAAVELAGRARRGSARPGGSRMIDDAVHDGRGAMTEAASTWLAFLVSPAAPQNAMSLLELDGYLTGVIVAPSLIPPGR